MLIFKVHFKYIAGGILVNSIWLPNKRKKDSHNVHNFGVSLWVKLVHFINLRSRFWEY